MAEAANKISSLAEMEKEPGGEYDRWQAEIQAAEKEVEKWRKRGRRIVKEFRAEHSEVSGGIDVNFERKFNLFAANTQILQTALLNQVPKPSADREFKDPKDDVGRVAAEILERALMAHNSRSDFKTYTIMKCIVQDMLVPGVGCSWHTYHADIEEKEEEPSAEQLELDPAAKPLKYEEVVGEELRDEYVYWEDLLWSPARTWAEVRWMSRAVYMTRDQLKERFGDEKGKEVALDYNPRKSETSVETKNQVFQQARIFEIWDKESKKIIWFSKGYDKLLDVKEDYLELDDFFPCPKPLFANVSNGQFVPIPDYEYARDQYRELNEINTRIGLLVRACRVAGVYDRSNGQVVALLSNAAENTLVPVDQWAAFSEKGGIKGVIDWVPLDQIVKTIEQLLKAREDIKAQIYEITGMSDIIRGASKASETLGAQKIKAQYASMRIQDRQKAVVLYASSIYEIQSQLMRKHMDVQEISKLAQVEFMSEDPQLVQQALQLITSPEFLMRVQVESDSLSDIDFQAEKADRLEYMQTISNFLKETMQTITSDPLLGPLMMQLLQFSLAGFKVGKKFEGELDKTFSEIQKKLANPQPPQPSPEEQKIKAEMGMMQEEFKMKQQGQQADLAFKAKDQQLNLQGKQQEAALKTQIVQQKGQQAQMAAQQKMQLDAVKARQDMIRAATPQSPEQV